MGTDWRELLKNKLMIRNLLLRQFIAEFLGTFILLALGDGCVAQSVLSRGHFGEFLSINFGWMVAVILAVYISGGVSGGHVNPAISLTMFLLGRISFIQLIVFQFAQYLGAFMGACIVFTIYYEAISDYDGGKRYVYGSKATAGIFATYPKDYLSPAGGFCDQLFGTMFLCFGVMAITDQKNMAVPKYFVPFAVGLVVLSIGISYGANCGYSINPARDLSPRLFTLVAGYGPEVFTAMNGLWFFIPWLIPYFGAVLGGIVYVLAIELHWPNKIGESAAGSTPLETAKLQTLVGDSTKTGVSDEHEGIAKTSLTIYDDTTKSSMTKTRSEDPT